MWKKMSRVSTHDIIRAMRSSEEEIDVDMSTRTLEERNIVKKIKHSMRRNIVA